jgi:hypothetical protein
VKPDQRDDPSGLAARYELERRRISEVFVEQRWQEARRRASLLLVFSVPLLAALLLASLPFLIRSSLVGVGGLIGVCLLGGLLGGLLVCVSQLVGVARTRHRSPEQFSPGLTAVVLQPFLAGTLAGLASGLAVLAFAGRESYKPQTLYLLAVALALWFARATALTRQRWLSEQLGRA